MSRRTLKFVLAVSLLLAVTGGFMLALSANSRPSAAQEGTEDSDLAPDGFVPEAVEPYDGGSNFLIIKDVNPWSCAANAQAITELGETYDVRNANQIPSVDLSEYKVVIVASDQWSSTYSTLAANRPALESFVSSGGVLLAHAADRGWNRGHWTTSFLPGAVHHGHGYQQYVSILEPSHPIVAGVPGGGPVTDAQLDSWNYSVHGYFTNLPAGTNKIIGVTGDPEGRPTYIEYPFGQGRVIASMHTVEWVWPGCGGASRANAAAGRNILRNEIRYALGAPEPPRKVVVFLRGIPSDLTSEMIGGCADSSKDPDFPTLERRLVGRGFRCSDFLDYSYAGGSMVDGEWQPTPYDCSSSGQSHVTSVGWLRAMLVAYQAEHPESQFVLVGHSQGGLLAFELLEQLRSGAVGEEINVSKVITMDSPLGGVFPDSWDRVAAIARRWWECFSLLTDSAAKDDMEARYESNPTIRNLETVDWAAALGIEVLTLGNWDDCVWSLQHCLVPEPFHLERDGFRVRIVSDERFPVTALTQVIRNASMLGDSDGNGYSMYDFCASRIPIQCGLIFSHIQVKKEAADDVAGFVGAQLP